MIISSRHKRSSLRTKVFKNISDIPRDDWNKVYPNVLEGYDYLRTLDESNLEQFSFLYVAVYENGALIGAANFFIMDYSLDTTINGPIRRLTNSIRRYAPNIFSIKALICGIPTGQNRMGLSGDRQRVFRAILRKAEQIAKKIKAHVIAFKDVDHSYSDILDPLQKEGFIKLDSLPNTELDITFANFEEYLDTLSSASRYDLRRKFKRVDNHVKIDMEVLDSIHGEVLQDVYKLYLEIVGKHDMGFELLPVDFFKNISLFMPKFTKFFLWRMEGRIVAFLFCLVSDDYLIDYYVGMDYSIAHKYHLYFVKFRDVLNWCIKHKIKKYEMGITGYEPKRRLGFEFKALFLYVKLRNRLLRPAFSFVCQFLKFENFDPSLRKAKKEMGK